MAGRQDGTPIADAAAALGLSPEAVRKRLQRGTLRGYKDDDGGWFVLLDGEPRAAGRQDTVRTERQDGGRTPHPDGRTDAEEPIEAAYRVTPVEIEQAVSRTSAQYMVDMQTMFAEVGKIYEGQIAAKDAALAAKDQALAAKDAALVAQGEAIATQGGTIADLRRRLAGYEEAEEARRAEDQLWRERAIAHIREREASGAPRRSGARSRENIDATIAMLKEEDARLARPAPASVPEPEDAPWWRRIFKGRPS